MYDKFYDIIFESYFTCSRYRSFWNEYEYETKYFIEEIYIHKIYNS